CHRAGVDDDRVGEPGLGAKRAHHLGFIGVEPAAEGEDVERHGQARPARSGLSRPVKLVATGPVMITWLSLAQPMRSTPPSSTTSASRPMSPRRLAATTAAQAPVPQARVMPTPRSHTRM